MRKHLGMLSAAGVLMLLLSSAQATRYSTSFPDWTGPGGLNPYTPARVPAVVPTVGGLASGLSSPATGASSGTFSDLQYTDAGLAMPLVDCEDATGAEEGLTCVKEGYFLTGFEREGHWVSGGGRVPLSQARCCRIAPPSEFPMDMGQGQVLCLLFSCSHAPLT